MQSAEQGNEFTFDASKITTTTTKPTTTLSAEAKSNQSAENDDEFADAADDDSTPTTATTTTADTIASLARKIQETKLSQAQEPPKPVSQPPAQRQASSQPGDDDLDIDIDAELENVDTSDVNLNDELSDD